MPKLVILSNVYYENDVESPPVGSTGPSTSAVVICKQASDVHPVQSLQTVASKRTLPAQRKSAYLPKPNVRRDDDNADLEESMMIDEVAGATRLPPKTSNAIEVTAGLNNITLLPEYRKLLRPVTIRQILAAEVDYLETETEHYTIDGFQVNEVKVVGSITKVTGSDSFIRYTIADGWSPGELTVTEWLRERREGADEYSLGDTVSVIGVLDKFSGRFSIKPKDAASMRKITDPHVSFHHQLEAMLCLTFLKKKTPLHYSPDSAANSQITTRRAAVHESMLVDREEGSVSRLPDLLSQEFGSLALQESIRVRPAATSSSVTPQVYAPPAEEQSDEEEMVSTAKVKGRKRPHSEDVDGESSASRARSTYLANPPSSPRRPKVHHQPLQRPQNTKEAFDPTKSRRYSHAAGEVGQPDGLANRERVFSFMKPFRICNPYNDLTTLQQQIILVILNVQHNSGRKSALYPMLPGMRSQKHDDWPGIAIHDIVSNISCNPRWKEAQIRSDITFLERGGYIFDAFRQSHYRITE